MSPSSPASPPDIANLYRRFAEDEARGKSPLYERLSLHIAGDGEVLAFLETVAPPKRQPNLLFGAVRYLSKAALEWGAFKAFVLDHAARLREVMHSRATQTNEPGRCAVLLTLLAQFPGPLALLEVGPSAGLCLLPDHYRYEYPGRRLEGPLAGPQSPLLKCVPGEGTPMPDHVPEIVWRAGLDLNPLDARDDADVEWLEALVWPEEADRLATLRAALATARAVSPPAAPRLVRGDLRKDLAALAAQAPRDATLVIFHTAVVTYLAQQAERDAFARQALDLAGHWISNEWSTVFPQFSRSLARPNPRNFLMMLDGVPKAWTDPHGRTMTWIG